ncbi:MAG: tRNA lysidine(34) synthetase TilS [Acidimicrobiia bacterium]
MPARAAADLVAALCRRADFTGIVAPVVVGCSGGADSVALLALANEAGLEPVAVHVDHRLREGSAADTVAVQDVADRLGVTPRFVAVDVAAGSNLEARARAARYRALESAREAADATWVLVGHTADDQAETVLLNVLRGAAASGLAGIPARRDRVARPLLALRRHETHELCSALGLTVLDDPMNDDLAFTRVALRRRVLPLLEEIAGRDLVPVLARQAEVLRAESDYLDDLARARWPGDGDLSARALAALHPVLAQRAIRVWLGPPPPSRAEVARVLEVARGACRAAQLAGGRAVRRSGGLLFVERD